MEILGDAFKVLAGGIIAILAGYVQSRINDRKDRRQLKAIKLERAHILAQLVYDGHKAQIDLARRTIPEAPGKFLSLRKHPGAEMSELNMLIRSYARKLTPCLGDISEGHQSLKNIFENLDKVTMTGEIQDAKKLSSNMSGFDENLDLVGNGASELKREIEAELEALVYFAPRWLRRN